VRVVASSGRILSSGGNSDTAKPVASQWWFGGDWFSRGRHGRQDGGRGSVRDELWWWWCS